MSRVVEPAVTDPRGREKILPPRVVGTRVQRLTCLRGEDVALLSPDAPGASLLNRVNAAKTCGSALHHAQSDGIHNKSWWDHVAEDLSEWGGEIAKIAGELAPILDIIPLATSWIPGLDVVTAALAEIDNMVMLVGTAMATVGDAMTLPAALPDSGCRKGMRRRGSSHRADLLSEIRDALTGTRRFELTRTGRSPASTRTAGRRRTPTMPWAM